VINLGTLTSNDGSAGFPAKGLIFMFYPFTGAILFTP
jgi:hypothetical protein